MVDEATKLADKFEKGGFGLCVEGETPTIMIAVSGPERDLIVAALRAPPLGTVGYKDVIDEALVVRHLGVAGCGSVSPFSFSYREAPMTDPYIRGYNDGKASSSTDEATRLALADEYERGMEKMIASGYEEYLPVITKHRIVIAALRSAPPASVSTPAQEPTMLRKGKHTEQRQDSKTWTAGIDALRKYDYQDKTQWHLHAIEFHHKDKAEAERLRDETFVLLIQSSAPEVTAPHNSGERLPSSDAAASGAETSSDGWSCGICGDKGRDQGDINQEVGGVMVTLAALHCISAKI